ncbi:MAG: DUF21 domain-containing protein [Planctomycetaceae bacterium]|nr:DUF21 domain-containing protein [Planctomycetaceae bacterium]
MDVLEALFSLLLLAAGVRLSAFFSGTETGFYRISLPRLTIEAQAGDRVAKRLLWFARHPSAFVATTLVGNNLANYLTTFAFSLCLLVFVGELSDLMEVVSVMLFAPVLFMFGELLPKNLYYRASWSLLRRDSTLFTMIYWLLLPASWPLVGVTKLIEKFSPSTGRRTELLLGRSHLVQLMTQGRHEGVLTDVQNRLANGVLQIAPQPIASSMTPANRVLGVSEQASRQEILDYARRFATPVVAIHRARSNEDWFAYVRVVDVSLSKKPVGALYRVMPELSLSSSKLDALQILLVADEVYGVVKSGDRVHGVVSSRGLCEQLFRPVTSAESRDA